MDMNEPSVSRTSACPKQHTLISRLVLPTAVIGLLALVTLVILAAVEWTQTAPPEVEVSAGKLRGKWIETVGGRAVAAFEGIPYAKPPVGELRFKSPVAAEPWSGVRTADSVSAMCIQTAGFETMTGVEDCLYLNVYAPEKVSRSEPLPVMVFVHGGGFFGGSGDDYGPEILLDRDVVYINLKYRLGVLGFLSTGDDVIPGNYGLKDQVLALKWVRDNVRAFGGDPDTVTIFGQSAGGASVHYLMLTPLARGLFHRAIAISGSALAPWAFHEPAHARAQATKVAEVLGCQRSTSEEIRKCLMSKTASDIQGTVQAFKQWLQHPLMVFKPTAEPSGAEAFIDHHPATPYAVTDVPLMTGIVANEGCVTAVTLLESPKDLNEFNERFVELGPIFFLTDYLTDSVNREVYRQLRKAYFGDAAISNATRWELMDLVSDAWFSYAALETVRLQKVAASSPVYFYEVTYYTERSWAVVFGGKEPNNVVCHGDDILHLFPEKSTFPQDPSATDRAFSKHLLDLYTTFAATGKPTEDGSWPEVRNTGSSDIEYVRLADPGQVQARSGFHPERMDVWPRLPVNTAIAGNTLKTRDQL